MYKKGDYVRMVIAPSTRMGTIVGVRTNERGMVEYTFRTDRRIGDPMPDIFVFEDEIQLCETPSDSHVAAINALIKRGT
jgi:hypothetical protein